jgi:hypothetical protein
MRDEIQCLIDWVDSIPSDERAHLILQALAEESLKKANLEEEKRRFTNKDIVAAARAIINEPANKWVSWNKRVLPYWETRKNQVMKLAKKRGLTSYPELGFYIPKNAGRGNESLYWLKAEPLPETSNNEEEQSSELEQEQARDKSRISFQYDLSENGEVKPSWIAKWLFHSGERRLKSWHFWLLMGYFFILGGIAVAIFYIGWFALATPRPVTTRELMTLISIFAVPYVIWNFAIKPWMRLIDDRIVPAPEFLVSLQEKSAQLELFKDGDLRLIRLVRYSAPCPICGATIHLEDGSPDYPRRLVGRCYDSPREHVFSFDRVTRRGAALRSPIV